MFHLLLLSFDERKVGKKVLTKIVATVSSKDQCHKTFLLVTMTLSIMTPSITAFSKMILSIKGV
jgi:hypothetical protein